jgi:putative membrane protein
MIQMGLLGALITLAPRALYAPHALTTWAWGLTPLQDQQLGGAIMWVPGGIVFLVAAGVLSLKALRPRLAPDLRPARA